MNQKLAVKRQEGVCRWRSEPGRTRNSYRCPFLRVKEFMWLSDKLVLWLIKEHKVGRFQAVVLQRQRGGGGSEGEVGG